MPSVLEVQTQVEALLFDFKANRKGDWIMTLPPESLSGETVNQVIKSFKVGQYCSVFLAGPDRYCSGGNEALEFKGGVLTTKSYGEINPFSTDNEFIHLTLFDLNSGDNTHIFIGEGNSYAGFIA
ncbi:hypothetical protein HYV12_03740 [Candidatus Dojkabacteria bacterium]|nr:hypothetical protein [Candidatus Dojkabacteria bacterium]